MSKPKLTELLNQIQTRKERTNNMYLLKDPALQQPASHALALTAQKEFLYFSQSQIAIFQLKELNHALKKVLFSSK